MKLKKVAPYLVIGGVLWLVVKCYNMPQVKTRPIYQPVKSAETFDHLYTDAHLTNVAGGQGG